MFLRRHFPSREAARVELGDELSDIVHNLRALLSSRQGSSACHEHYGLSTIGFLTAQEMVTQLGTQIRKNVEAFEPRLEVLACDEVFGEQDEAYVLVRCAVRAHALPLYILANPRRTEITIGMRPRGVS